MKNRKKATLVCSAALVGVIGIGATLAYFTDSDEATNVVTMGHVDISLNEGYDESEGKGADEIIGGEGMVFDNIMPGDTLSKIPKIVVEPDSQDAYVRMKMDIETDADSDITEADINELESRLSNQITEGTGWAYDGEYYYYNKSLSAGEEAEFFRTVTIPETWKNNTTDDTFRIKLQAEAIQAENITPEWTENGNIMGWPEAEIEKYN
nr:SipW-dependent-type signal peptide-containing protein [uncultured Sellimonas sp.]